jgi:cytochrome c oxidase subunit II
MNGNATIQMPPQASTVAPQVDALYYFIFWGCTFFFLLIVGFTIFFVFKYRRTKVERMEKAFHNTPLEITWTVVPTILVMIVFVWGFRGYMNMSVSPGNALEYYVTGKKWLWQVTDPNGAVTINEMTVPLHQPVKIILRSEDLIHSFFVPAFRVKQDAIPNRYNTLWFEATLPGDFDIFCTEYCGAGHSGMLGKVHVLTSEKWAEYLKSTGGRPATMPLEEWGAKLYAGKACITCHSLDGSKKTGPSFKGMFGHPVVLKDGSTITADEEYIRRSIMEPGAQVVSGFDPVMPVFAGSLSPDDIDALVAFVKKQQ